MLGLKKTSKFHKAVIQLKQVNMITGIQSTGTLHLGHYLGVIHQCVKLSKQKDFTKEKNFIFIADLHSLTNLYYENNEQMDEKLNLRHYSLDLMAMMLACGMGAQFNIFL